MSSGSPRSNSSTSEGDTSGQSVSSASTDGKTSGGDSSPESTEAAHPLTGVIPPMLVYNCIDEEEHKVETTTREENKGQRCRPHEAFRGDAKFFGGAPKSASEYS